ncbi:probable leucine-rich repeat receptor-like protein kinase At1g68400 [Euphorbia lathyris]|uniref:probable leucine-rich repeat receptor-like protein kinase At1g68400 n=1 Tax=Euphorbia lathyris TaxID=212925 RepID=UPI00331343AF
MVPYKLSFFVFFLLFFCHSHGSISSSHSDFNALLSFKKSSLVPSQFLSSWVNSTNPCFHSWFGVTCNPTTHRVTQLVLQNLNLTGSLHSLTLLSQLRLLSLNHNHLSSFSNFSFSSWPNLKLLYLSHNRLSGTFPPGISSLRRLHRLDLSHNYFTGNIPMSDLATLPHLLTLRLEANSFAGTIDSVYPLFSSISEFNVSDNILSGEIPSWLSNFPASSFSGNSDLCGSPLPRECSNQTARSQSEQPRGVVTGKKRKTWLVIMIVGVDAAAIVAAVVSIACCCYYKSRRNSRSKSNGEVIKRKEPQIGGYYYGGGGGPREGEEMVVFEGCKRLNDVDDLLKSSAELLGKGCAGTTYKVEMDSGDVVVVKRIRKRRRKKDCSGWLRMIGGLRHSNIVSLRAYYNSKDELLLVYDFLSNGSLHSLLHGNRGPGRTAVGWGKRLEIASGAAKGLAFFHGYNKAKLCHGNLKSTNILVDELGNVCISEIGIYQLLQYSPPNSNTIAPELLNANSNQKLSQKCDVYSFGVIMVEILTGKMANGEGETSLVRWVKRVPQQEWSREIFDYELWGDKDMEKEMVGLMQLALLCLAPLPKDRPNMNMVYRMIQDITTTPTVSNSVLSHLSSDSSPSVSFDTFY